MLYFFQNSFVCVCVCVCVFFTNLCVHIGFSRFSFKFLFLHDFVRYSLVLVGVFLIDIECQTSQVLSPIGNLIGSKSLIETKVDVLLFSKCIQSILLQLMSKLFH
jgi:hypothetical protein